MNLTTVQWNIGGGKVRDRKGTAYELDGVDQIVATLQAANPDIITLQEVHKNEAVDQAQDIASRLGLQYYAVSYTHLTLPTILRV